MSFDIYGYPLRQGYCEVHPEVHQSYPCSLCYAESKKADDDKRMEKEHYKQIEAEHHRDMEIEEQKHSFARRCAEWVYLQDYIVVSESDLNVYWTRRSESIPKTTAQLLTEFIEWKKQQEGRGE